MKHRIDPEGRRLPIKLDSTSNGEFAPVPLSPANLAANRLAHEFVSSCSKKTNLTRRRFLVSSCGAASTLLAFNEANATRAGYFDVPREAALDEALAQATVGAKREFIFDVQGHFVDVPRGSNRLLSSPNFGRDRFIKEIFMDSDTDLMVLERQSPVAPPTHL